MKKHLPTILLIILIAVCCSLLPNAFDQSQKIGKYEKYAHEAPQFMKEVWK